MHPLERQFGDAVNFLKLPAKSCIAVACSGGGDSMALTLLAQNWAKTHKLQLVALTVDHGLRKGSAAEAKQVSLWLKKRRIAHNILTWKGRKPKRNIQETARKARYQLLADYCKQQGIQYLLVAHHLEDQAETFLLRLARGSGVDGLSAMAASTTIYDITLLRPLLGTPKALLINYLNKHKQAYVNDPSNENTVFDRIKMRALLPTLAPLGLTADRLAKTAANMARARAHLEEETGRFLRMSCKITAEGYARLELLPASSEIALRVLATLIMLIGGQDVKTRLNELERLYSALLEPHFKGATLGGCVFARHKNTFLIYRELKAVARPAALKAGAALMWDNRFEITCKNKGAYRVGALTQGGWLKLAKAQSLKFSMPNKNILYSLPTIRDLRGRIMAVPQLKFSVKDFICESRFKSEPSKE